MLANLLPQNVQARVSDLKISVHVSTHADCKQFLGVEEPDAGAQHSLRKVPFCMLRLPRPFRRISHAFNCFRQLQTMIGKI